MLTQYDRLIGLALDDVAVDGCMTKAPSGRETAGRSPVDGSSLGLKRATMTHATDMPLHLVATRANRQQALLLSPKLAGQTRWGRSRQVGKPWVVERAQVWMSGIGTLCRCTERNGQIVSC